jgi:hypothetical protein
MGIPITKGATVVCDQGGQVNFSAVSSNIQVDGNDVVDATDVGMTKAPIIGCKGHPPPSPAPGKLCTSIVSWNILLNTLQDDGQPVAGSAVPPTPVAVSDVPIAIITCTDPGNTKLFAN